MIRSTHARAVATTLLLIVMHGRPAAAQARRRFVNIRPTPKIALLPVINNSKVGGDAVADAATETITRLLQDRRELLVVPPADAQKVAGAVDLRDPALTAEQQVAFGRLLNVDWVLRFVITQAGVYQARRPYGALELNGYALSTDHGRLAGRVYARGARWDQTQSGRFNPNVLLAQAAADAVDQVVELTSIESVVTNKLENGMVRVALGTQNFHFRMNGEVMFIDGDEVLGYGDTVEVDDTQSLIRLRTPSSAQRIGVNTRVRVVYNPPLYAKGRTVKELERRIEKREDIIFFIAGAATLVTGYLQSRLHSSLAGNPAGAAALNPGVPPIPIGPAVIPPGAIPPPPPP